MPPPNRRPKSPRSSPLPTVAEALADLAAWTDVPEGRRRVLASALGSLVKLAGLPADALRLDPLASLELMEAATPATLGRAASTFANHRAGLRYILRRRGLLAPLRQRTPEVTDGPWAELFAALPAGPAYGRLRAFIAFCAAEEVPPGAVGPETLEAYVAHRAAERGGTKAADKARRAATQWNRAAREIPAWPQIRLGARAAPLRRSPPFSAYPASLNAEIDAYLAAIGGTHDGGLFAGAGQPPVAASTVLTRRYSLRRLLHGAVESGIPAAELTSLRCVVAGRFIEGALSWHHARGGGQLSADLHQLAATIASVANHLRLPAEEMRAVKARLARVKLPQRQEVTEGVARLLDALDDPARRARLLHLPARLMAEAETLRAGSVDQRGQIRQPRPVEAAWFAATAAAIEILLHAPMRLGNLQSLRMGEELRLVASGRGRWRGTILVAADRVKNRRGIEVPLSEETLGLLRAYIDTHRPALPNADTAWLFPGAGSPEAPRHKGAFGQAITEAIAEHVGLRVNPHAFRGFAGSLILEENPHAIDDVRAILGHSSFETALLYYRRNDGRGAAQRLSATLSRTRRATALQARAGLLAQGLRRGRRGT